MIRVSPVLLLLLVTPLLGFYGRSGWAFLAGPVAALAVWALGRTAEKPAAPAPARRRPAPVD